MYEDRLCKHDDVRGIRTSIFMMMYSYEYVMKTSALNGSIDCSKSVQKFKIQIFFFNFFLI